MEAVLFGSFMIQYDVIKANLVEMKPFLNINEDTGSPFYRSIFVLKILFVVYAIDRIVDKPLSLVFKLAGDFCSACKNPVFRDIIPNILSTAVIFLLYKEALTLISVEFLIDIFMLIFLLNNAVKAYKKELQKISSMIFMCLFFQWYVNNTANTEHFELCTYFQVLGLLFLPYLPLTPNNPKYKLKLTYFYLIMSIWAFYKLGQPCDRHNYVLHQNKIEGGIGEDQHTKLEPERGKLDALQNLDVNNESICCDAGNVQNFYQTSQKVVPSNDVFSSNPEQNIAENLERIYEPASFSKGIKSEDSRNIMKNDIPYVKELRKHSKTSDHRTEKLKFHDIVQFQPNGSSESSVLENEQKTEEAMFKLPKTVSTEGESMLDEPNSEHDKLKDIDNYKYTKKKEMTAQSEETQFEEEPKRVFDSINENSEKENYVTAASSKDVNGNKVADADEVANSDIEITEAGNTAYRKFEMSESNDANFKPEGTKILKGKRTIKIFKAKGNELIRKVGSDGSAIQKSTDSSIVHKMKVGPIKIGLNDGTKLKTKNHGANSGRSLMITSKPKKQIKAKKVPMINLEKKQNLLPNELSKTVLKRSEKLMKKGFLAVGNEGSD